MPNADIQEVTAAPSPPEDPPTVRLVSYGLLVCPINIFLVSCLKFENIARR